MCKKEIKMQVKVQAQYFQTLEFFQALETINWLTHTRSFNQENRN